MATFGHLAVGAAIGSAYQPESRLMPCFFASLALLPDTDFFLRLPHRGITHSFAFAIVVGAACALALWDRRMLVFATIAVASHGALDALTDGGSGIALLWPLSDARVFAPWRPIHAAPLGARMLSLRGVYLVGLEMIWFAPCVVYVRRRMRAFPSPSPRT